jgi:phosphate transport system permease protein/phosphate transport system substrate-binding protein
VSPEWKEKVGRGTAVQWPTGRGAPGNEGVATTVNGAKFSIGYVELSYALTTGMNYAYIQNQAGNFIEPTLESTREAVSAAAGALPAAGDASWDAVSLVNAPGDKSYPVASFSYLLLYKEMSTSPKIDSPEKARAIVDFVAWAISPGGQEHARKLSYVPLPDSVVALNQKTLASLTFQGKALYGTSGAPVTTAPAAQEEATAAADLKVTSSGKKTSKLANIKVKGTAGSADIYSFTAELSPAGGVKSAKGPAGWKAEVDGSIVTFATEDRPIKAGKTVTFRVTGASAIAGFEWSAGDAAGNVLGDGAVKRR